MDNEKLVHVFGKILKLEARFFLTAKRKDLLEWDSLNHIRLAREIEKVFSVKFSVQELRDVDSFESFKRMIVLLQNA